MTSTVLRTLAVDQREWIRSCLVLFFLVNCLVDFESSFVVAGINNYERFDFFGMSGVPVLCAVACFHTRLDIQHGHSTAQHSTDTHSTVMLKFYCKCGCVHDDS